ncbi:hypothetical protein N9O51_05015 [Saprospiraceae bacterium]|nr:hypothetical protein [Saprospiraceae bacterium]
MDKHLETLYTLFRVESFENDADETLQKIIKDFGIPEISSTNLMKYILDHIYQNDSINILKNMLGIEGDGEYGMDADLDLVWADFERGDWSEEGEDRDNYEEMYGEEGYNYYNINTKKYLHEFQEMKPFSEGLQFVGSTLRK